MSSPLSPSRSDEALVLGVAAGEEAAFAELMRRYHPALHRYAARLLRDEDRANDVLQEMFWRLWNGRATLDVGAGRVRSYLFAATHRVALTHGERAVREGTRAAILDPALRDPAPWADAEVERAELMQAVREAVDELPKRCREIYLLSREGGLSYPEIADVLGVSLSTIKTQMSRAMGVLYSVARPFLVLVLGIGAGR